MLLVLRPMWMKALLVVLIAGAVSGGAYLWYRSTPEYEARKIAEEIKKEYAEDPYGGETPEETLRLFIDALKKGDTDLAAKYFVMDEQEEWRKILLDIKEGNLINDMVRDLEREKDKKIVGTTKNIFYIYNDESVLALGIEVVLAPNGKWKILDL